MSKGNYDTIRSWFESIKKLTKERDALPVNDPRITELNNAISILNNSIDATIKFLP